MQHPLIELRMGFPDAWPLLRSSSRWGSCSQSAGVDKYPARTQHYPVVADCVPTGLCPWAGTGESGVDVLIIAALPRAMRAAKVDRQTGTLGDFRMMRISLQW